MNQHSTLVFVSRRVAEVLKGPRLTGRVPDVMNGRLSKPPAEAKRLYLSFAEIVIPAVPDQKFASFNDMSRSPMFTGRMGRGWLSTGRVRFEPTR